jgi:hypothetical protein
VQPRALQNSFEGDRLSLPKLLYRIIYAKSTEQLPNSSIKPEQKHLITSFYSISTPPKIQVRCANTCKSNTQDADANTQLGQKHVRDVKETVASIPRSKISSEKDAAHVTSN